jgi:cytochrome c-type biogenesis protein CcmH
VSKLFILWSLCLLSFSSLATSERYEFASNDQLRRFQQLSNELRCPKCQNNALSDSQSPLAEDLRLIIASKIKQGASNEDIVQFMTERYGNFIRYQPPLTMSTSPLWLVPLLVLIFATLMLWRTILRHRQEESSNDE